MKHIIVPTDFSATALNAAYYAAGLARQVHAGVMLLHVLPIPITTSEVLMSPDSYGIALEEANNALLQLREKLHVYSNGQLHISYRTTTTSFAEEIEAFKQEHDIFAVVMGTTGAGATEAFFLGSFSRMAAKRLHHPLIVVPPAYTYKPIEKIGLACDMKRMPLSLPVGGLQALLEYYPATLDILYVSKSTEHAYPETVRESRFLQSSLSDYDPEIRIVPNDNIKKGLNEVVRQSGIDLLVLLPKERNFTEGLFHKSVTQKMILHPDVPVMVLHA
ncbi:MAG TPA: universal stress protein [Chitinophaga sp.]